MSKTESFEQLAEIAAPIIDSLRKEIIGFFSQHNIVKNPRGEHLAKALNRIDRNPELFYVFVSQIVPFEKKPTLRLCVNPIEEGEKGSFIELPKIMSDKILTIPDGDFYTLIEYGALNNLQWWEKNLSQSSEEHLAANYNDVYTNQEHYEINIARSKSTLKQIQSGQNSIKSAVDVPYHNNLIG